MPRIEQLDPENVSPWTKKLFEKIEKSMGIVPNMFKCMGNSDDAFQGFLEFNANLMNSKLGPKTIKMIILATSELNGCDYCASAHTKMALDAGLMNADECLNARRLVGPDEKTTVLLKFTGKIVKNRGQVTDEDIQSVTDKGWSDQEIIECLGTISLITFANYVSNVCVPDLDFPEVPRI